MEYGFAFFPGQGAQAPGMGKDLYENSKAARLVFEEASDGAGIDVAKLCFDSDKETLSRTENSQIAIFTHSMAALAALREAGVTFKAAAGFSLGEYTSLAAAGVVTLADGVKIVSKRGKLMQHAADTIDGGMAAILGLEDAKIEEACAAVKNGIVRPVNYNLRVRERILRCAERKLPCMHVFCNAAFAHTCALYDPFIISIDHVLKHCIGKDKIRQARARADQLTVDDFHAPQNF